MSEEFFAKVRKSLTEIIKAEKTGIDLPAKLRSFAAMAALNQNLMIEFYFSAASVKEFDQMTRLLPKALKYNRTPSFIKFLDLIGLSDDLPISSRNLERSHTNNDPRLSSSGDSDFDTCLDLAVIMKGMFGKDD